MKLIDADKLLRFFTVDTANQTYRFGTIKKQIENAETVQAIVIPQNATNGDMMETIFPKIEMWGESKDTLDYSLGGMIHRVMKSWWNSPYKGVEND